MDTQTEAQIYLADQRGCTETDLFRSQHTFNTATYTAPGREPFGSVYQLNDILLRAEGSLSQQVDQDTQVVLLPVIGGLEYAVDGITHFLEPGQAGLLTLRAGTTYHVSNPYPAELVNYLQLGLTIPTPGSSSVVRQQAFDLTQPNTLMPLFNANVSTPAEDSHESGTGTVAGFIGRFGGREEGTYPIKLLIGEETRRVFAFALQGAFELANRLMHGRDGLALTYHQDDVLEFEALSNDALLLLLIA